MIKHQSIYNNQSKRIYINCRIEDFEIYNESKFLRSKHVNYIIEINTFYKNWTIKKRYSEFEDLNKILITKITDLSEFPQKRLFSASEDTITERKKKFENYLNHLFRNINICIYPEILEFIKLEKDLLNLFMINNSDLENTSNSAIKRNNILIRNNSICGDKFKSKSYEKERQSNYFTSFLDYKLNASDKKEKITKSANMLVIEEFLRNLEFKYENKLDIIKTFENFLKSKKNWPTFKLDELSKLFYGDIDINGNIKYRREKINEYTYNNDNSNNINNLSTSTNLIKLNNNRDKDKDTDIDINKKEKDIYLKGIIYHIGSLDENLLGAEACLEFLAKLINFEFNPECEAYIYMLKITKVDQLNNLRLIDHINNGKNNIILASFNILNAILKDDRSFNIKLKKILNDEIIIERFLLWNKSNLID